MNRERILALAQEMQSHFSATAEMAAEIERLASETPAPPAPEPPEPGVLLEHWTEIGNPNAGRWAGDSVMACFARGPRDMQRFPVDERIYFGGGDHTGGPAGGNMGPVPIFSFGIDGAFSAEVSLMEEIVDQLLVSDNTLWIPGTDVRGGSSSFVHFKVGGRWGKLPALQNAAHVWSMTVISGNVYALASYFDFRRIPSKIWRYDVAGSAWVEVDRARTDGDVKFNTIVDLDDSLLVFGRFKKTGDTKGHPCIYAYPGGERRIVVSDPFPNAPFNPLAKRVVHYQTGLLYGDTVSGPGVWLPPNALTLYRLDSSMNVSVAWRSENEYLRDIVVRGSTVYIMTLLSDTDRLDNATEFRSRILRSTDLKDWRPVADCVFPALPYSFEILGDSFFVALGSRSKGRATADDPGYKDVAAGAICQLRA